MGFEPNICYREIADDAESKYSDGNHNINANGIDRNPPYFFVMLFKEADEINPCKIVKIERVPKKIGKKVVGLEWAIATEKLIDCPSDINKDGESYSNSWWTLNKRLLIVTT